MSATDTPYMKKAYLPLCMFTIYEWIINSLLFCNILNIK